MEGLSYSISGGPYQGLKRSDLPIVFLPRQYFMPGMTATRSVHGWLVYDSNGTLIGTCKWCVKWI